jgi:hypothetical protein
MSLANELRLLLRVEELIAECRIAESKGGFSLLLLIAIQEAKKADQE